MNKKIIILSTILLFCLVAVLQAENSQNLFESIIGVRSQIADDGYGYGYNNHEYPDTPENFSAITRRVTYIILGWTAPSQEVSFYTIRYGKTRRTLQSKSVIGSREQTKLKHLASATKYYAKIKATNDNGSSAFSDTISFRTLPAKVKNVRVPSSSITANSFRVMWKKVHGTNIFYRLQVRNSKGKIIRKITTKKINRIVKGLESASLYRVKVRAMYRKKSSQAGNWSDIVRVWTN
jgi:hypothetical protein